VEAATPTVKAQRWQIPVTELARRGGGLRGCFLHAMERVRLGRAYVLVLGIFIGIAVGGQDPRRRVEVVGWIGYPAKSSTNVRISVLGCRFLMSDLLGDGGELDVANDDVHGAAWGSHPNSQRNGSRERRRNPN